VDPPLDLNVPHHRADVSLMYLVLGDTDRVGDRDIFAAAAAVAVAGALSRVMPFHVRRGRDDAQGEDGRGSQGREIASPHRVPPWGRMPLAAPACGAVPRE